jgi:hypothetical protein
MLYLSGAIFGHSIQENILNLLSVRMEFVSLYLLIVSSDYERHIFVKKLIIVLLVTGIFFLIFCTTLVGFVGEIIFAFFCGISFIPFEERLSDVEVIFLFGCVSVSSDIVDVTGTLSKSTSMIRTFVGVVFFGIRLSIGSVGVVTLVVFSILFGFTVAIGLLSTFVGG